MESDFNRDRKAQAGADAIQRRRTLRAMERNDDAAREFERRNVGHPSHESIDRGTKDEKPDSPCGR